MAKLYGDDPLIAPIGLRAIEEIWTKCLQLGVDVVLDFGCWTRQERDALRGKIATIGAQGRPAPGNLLRGGGCRRVEERDIDPNIPFISPETFEVLKQCYAIEHGSIQMCDGEASRISSRLTISRRANQQLRP